MNATDPLHWTLNSCIAEFRSVWEHFGLFPYCTKLGTKWAALVQLMHMFLPRSRVKIFHNECTRSNPLDPKLMFWCVSQCLGTFGILSLLIKLGSKMVELVQLMQKFVPRNCVGIFRNECTQCNQLDPKSMFWCVS